MIFFQNIYCGNCQRCIGFQNGSVPLPTLYCLDCETDVRCIENEQEAVREHYRSAVARAFSDARK